MYEDKTTAALGSPSSGRIDEASDSRAGFGLSGVRASWRYRGVRRLSIPQLPCIEGPAVDFVVTAVEADASDDAHGGLDDLDEQHQHQHKNYEYPYAPMCSIHNQISRSVNELLAIQQGRVKTVSKRRVGHHNEDGKDRKRGTYPGNVGGQAWVRTAETWLLIRKEAVKVSMRRSSRHWNHGDSVQSTTSDFQETRRKEARMLMPEPRRRRGFDDIVFLRMQAKMVGEEKNGWQDVACLVPTVNLTRSDVEGPARPGYPGSGSAWAGSGFRFFRPEPEP
ncbi:hypothetical protein B0H11DRAFT_1915820 [Mycena galericulata]|nr:hypothetical protein B0H11DRAFT_1915820 [Mycena galericulata]